MRRHNDGMIYTNDKCVACNHCVHVCPSMGANVSANDEGRISIDVSDKNCIHCGMCINECMHGARCFRDSIDDLLRDLRLGVKIAVLVDPAFMAVYGKEKAERVFAYLRSIGVRGIYDASVGGEISLYYHIRYIREHADENGKCDRFLAHTCPGFSNYVSRYSPDALDMFVPVQLPSVCAAIYYRKYKGVSERFALLSPCTAIYDEMNSFSSGKNINYLIGFSSLLNHIGEEELPVPEKGFDIEYEGPGSVLCESDAFATIVAKYFPSDHMFKTSPGVDAEFEKVLNTPELKDHKYHPTLSVHSSCKLGCIEGPAIRRDDFDMNALILQYGEIYERSMKDGDDHALSPDDRYERLSAKFLDLNVLDFEWEGDEDYHQSCPVPENVVEEIFASMHKTTPEKKSVDCQACGYKSCYEMVCAVANGYSRVEDCVHYLNDEMKLQLGIDSLTGLYNTRGFLKAASRLVAENPDKRYVFVVGDINGLGGINDLYGNTGGDLVISYVAKVLQEFSDKRGECGRLGAATFGCIFEDIPENREKFKTDTQLSVSHLGIEYPLTMKFGMYEITDRAVPSGRALLYATYAYRTSKDRSRNTYVLYTEEMSRFMSQEAEVTQGMKPAMENGEFVLYLQPKYDHVTGRMVGAEVLSRWLRPDGSIVSPGLFIPVFEKNGFITELDRYVWKSSFEMVSGWLCDGYDAVPVSVNISRISLMDDGIISYIGDLKKKHPDAAEFIQFEITESAYVGNTDEIFGRVQKIREMGFMVNMDDFGSGYSSLNLLKDAPIDIVKLDMGFLRGADTMGRGNIIISAVVNMTKELGFEMVAEGVETKDQADLLTGMGCSVIQGYYYAKPMPEDQFLQKLKL